MATQGSSVSRSFAGVRRSSIFLHFIVVVLLEWKLGEPAEPSGTHRSKLQNFYESVRFRHPPPIFPLQLQQVAEVFFFGAEVQTDGWLPDVATICKMTKTVIDAGHDTS